MMKNLHFHIFLIAVATLSFLTGCIEDSFTTDSSHRLEFSADTLSFDTIITETVTPTAKFVVYNRHKKMLNIQSIRVKGESEATIHLNVDGERGEVFHDIEVRGEDSIYVFVQAHIDTNNANEPVKIEDKIEFVTNGVPQDVVVRAWGMDVERIKGGTISADTRFTAAKPYLIFDTLHVAKGATLHLDAGARLMFHDKGALKVDGRLVAKGEKGRFVHLRGDRLDKVLPDVSYDMMSGQWGGVIFGEESYGNEMEYVYMRGSTSGITIDSCACDRRKLHMFNSVLHNAAENVITSNYAWIEAEGCEFSDANNAVLAACGGIIRFANCTLANYYLFGAITSPIITLSYLLPEEQQELPLMKASFDNCIVYGNTSDINMGDLTGSQVFLRNCLLKSKGQDDDNFMACVWGGDPKFFTERSEYIFDYRLKNESSAIALGNIEYLPESARYDMLGNDRLSGNGLDIGAYTYIPQTEENPDEK